MRWSFFQFCDFSYRRILFTFRPALSLLQGSHKKNNVNLLIHSLVCNICEYWYIDMCGSRSGVRGGGCEMTRERGGSWGQLRKDKGRWLGRQAIVSRILLYIHSFLPNLWQKCCYADCK